MSSAIAVRIGDAIFQGWTSVTVTTSLGLVAASVQFSGASAPARTIRTSEEIEVLHGDQRVFRGYMDDLELAITRDATSFNASGRSLSADLVDSQIDPIGGPGPAKNQTIEGLVIRYAGALSPRIPIDTSLLASTARIPDFAYGTGETYWAAIERALRTDGVLATAGADGGIKLVSPNRFERLPLLLREGENVTSMRAVTSFKERAHFSVARGQGSPAGDWESSLEVLGEAIDQAIRKSRVHVFQVEGQPTEAECAARAAWEQAIRAARGSRVTVGVPSWSYGVDGATFRPGLIAPVALPSIGISGSMVIDAVQLVQDENGRRSILSLVRKDAYQPQPQLSAESDTVASSWEGEA